MFLTVAARGSCCTHGDAAHQVATTVRKNVTAAELEEHPLVSARLRYVSQFETLGREGRGHFALVEWGNTVRLWRPRFAPE